MRTPRVSRQQKLRPRLNANSLLMQSDIYKTRVSRNPSGRAHCAVHEPPEMQFEEATSCSNTRPASAMSPMREADETAQIAATLALHVLEPQERQVFGQGKGSLEYHPTGQPEDQGSGSVGFNNHCPEQPRSDLLAMRNPTCDLRNYSGGQLACHHMWSLLDADQPIPWPDRPLEYALKFRFWVEEYNMSYHTGLRRVTWGIASPVEYDVPKCSEGMMGCSRESDGSWIHTIKGTFTGEGVLSAAHFHCHAPTCLSMAMYRCPKGTKVCDQTTGELLCVERPVYGNSSGDPFAEPGYIFQPPCLWGSEEFGLQPPPSVEGFVLGTVKTSNATYGHRGEMAWQQMYVFDPTTSRDTELV